MRCIKTELISCLLDSGRNITKSCLALNKSLVMCCCWHLTVVLADEKLTYYLGANGVTKTDEFSEKFKQPLAPSPLIFRKSCYNFFPPKICNKKFWIENEPFPPLQLCTFGSGYSNGEIMTDFFTAPIFFNCQMWAIGK